MFVALHRWHDRKLDTSIEFLGIVFRMMYNNHLEDIKRYKTDYPAESHATFVNLLEECKYVIHYLSFRRDSYVSSRPDSASGGITGSSGLGLAALMANGNN